MHDNLELRPVSRGQDGPASFAQQRLWFLDALKGDREVTYNIVTAARIFGPLNVEALRRALSAVVNRHEILRTSFRLSDDHSTLLQIVAERAEIDLRVARVAENQLSEAISLRARERFDLSTGPLLYVHLLCLDQSDHVLVINSHDIISDQWSAGIFARELSELYGSYAHDKKCNLPELKVQYADYAHWERRKVSEAEASRSREFWIKELQGAPTQLQLPTDYLPPSSGTFKGAIEAFSFPKSVLVTAKTLCRTEGVTLFTLLMAAFVVLLSRISGQTDVVVGTLVSSRRARELENLIGLFLDTVVVRSRVETGTRFIDHLHQVGASVLSALEHQDTQFETLVAAINPDRNSHRHPVFQAALVMQDAPVSRLALPGLDVREMGYFSESSRFDIMVRIGESPDGFIGSVEYSTELFRSSTIRRFVGQLRALMESIASDPTRELGALSIVTNQEREELLFARNNTAKSYGDLPPVHRLFEEQAAIRPDAVAVASGDRVLTYEMLNRLSLLVARRLLELGVTAGTPVALYLGNSVELVVTLLAVLRAGATYVPIDPSYPKARVTFILNDSGAKVVIAEPGRLDRSLDGTGIAVCYADELCAHAQAIETSEASARVPEIDRQAAAYIIYTSGSTGQPKGAAVSHTNLSNLIAWYVAEYHLSENDRAVIASAVSFDLTQKNIWGPLSSGGAVYLPNMEVFDPDVVISEIARNRITTINCTPSLFYTLIEKKAGWRLLRSLRVVLLGGEPIDVRRMRPWFDSGERNATVVNMYGPTECTDISTVFEIRDLRAAHIPIGKPISNVQVYLLNEKLQVQPAGVDAELYIGGAGVGLGYVGKPELTADKFLPNPFSDTPGDRLYRTGDLVRYREDGNIEFVGRIDNQVKIRGVRIELGEIEAVIQEIDGIEQAVVVAHERQGEKYLAAYVVLDVRDDSSAETPIEESSLLAHLRERLPAVMVPTSISVMTNIPLNVNGKVDRRALQPPAPGVDLANDFAPLCDEREFALARIWSEVLGIPIARIGRSSNFFAVGGHSLTMLHLRHAILERMSTDIPIRRLYRESTLSAMAEEIRVTLELSSRAQGYSRAFPFAGFSPKPEDDAVSASEFIACAASLTERYRKKHNVPGVAVGAYHDGRESFFCSGVADENLRSRVSEDTTFRIGCSIKSIVATAVVKLVERGVLRLDQPVLKYLPSLPKEHVRLLDKVVLQNLLCNTSGITGSYEGWLERDGESIEILRARELRAAFKPGELCAYNDYDYLILATILEAACDQYWKVVVRSEVLDDIEARLLDEDPNCAASYGQDASGNSVRISDRACIRDCPAWGTKSYMDIRGLLAFARLHCLRGRQPSHRAILSDQGVEIMRGLAVPIHGSPDFSGISPGWLRYRDGSLGNNGNAIGQQASMRILPREETALAFFANSYPSTTMLNDLLYTFYTPDDRMMVSVEDETFDDVQGRYLNSDTEAVVSNAADGIRVAFSNSRYTTLARRVGNTGYYVTATQDKNYQGYITFTHRDSGGRPRYMLFKLTQFSRIA